MIHVPFDESLAASVIARYLSPTPAPYTEAELVFPENSLTIPEGELFAGQTVENILQYYQQTNLSIRLNVNWALRFQEQKLTRLFQTEQPAKIAAKTTTLLNAEAPPPPTQSAASHHPAARRADTAPDKAENRAAPIARQAARPMPDTEERRFSDRIKPAYLTAVLKKMLAAPDSITRLYLRMGQAKEQRTLQSSTLPQSALRDFPSNARGSFEMALAHRLIDTVLPSETGRFSAARANADKLGPPPFATPAKTGLTEPARTTNKQTISGISPFMTDGAFLAARVKPAGAWTFPTTNPPLYGQSRPDSRAPLTARREPEQAQSAFVPRYNSLGNAVIDPLDIKSAAPVPAHPLARWRRGALSVSAPSAHTPPGNARRPEAYERNEFAAGLQARISGGFPLSLVSSGQWNIEGGGETLLYNFFNRAEPAGRAANAQKSMRVPAIPSRNVTAAAREPLSYTQAAPQMARRVENESLAIDAFTRPEMSRRETGDAPETQSARFPSIENSPYIAAPESGINAPPAVLQDFPRMELLTREPAQTSGEPHAAGDTATARRSYPQRQIADDSAKANAPRAEKRHAAGTPMTDFAFPAAGTPVTGSSASAAGTPVTGLTTSAAGTPVTGLTTSAAGTLVTGLTISAMGTPVTGLMTSAVGTPITNFAFPTTGMPLTDFILPLAGTAPTEGTAEALRKRIQRMAGGVITADIIRPPRIEKPAAEHPPEGTAPVSGAARVSAQTLLPVQATSPPVSPPAPEQTVLPGAARFTHARLAQEAEQKQLTSGGVSGEISDGAKAPAVRKAFPAAHSVRLPEMMRPVNTVLPANAALFAPDMTPGSTRLPAVRRTVLKDIPPSGSAMPQTAVLQGTMRREIPLTRVSPSGVFPAPIQNRHAAFSFPEGIGSAATGAQSRAADAVMRTGMEQAEMTFLQKTTQEAKKSSPKRQKTLRTVRREQTERTMPEETITMDAVGSRMPVSRNQPVRDEMESAQVNIDKLADRVYRVIENRLRSEKLRRGML